MLLTRISKSDVYQHLKGIKEDDTLVATLHNNDDRLHEVVVGKMSWFVLTQFDILFQGNPGY